MWLADTAKYAVPHGFQYRTYARQAWVRLQDLNDVSAVADRYRFAEGEEAPEPLYDRTVSGEAELSAGRARRRVGGRCVPGRARWSDRCRVWRLDGQSKRRRPTQLLDQVAVRSDGGAGLSERVAGLRADLPPRGFGQEFGVVEVASSLIVDGAPTPSR
jgi:hypothetical protein